MATSKEFRDYAAEQLSGLEGVAFRAMMGEYVLYCRGRVVGGLYDDRLLLKATPSALRLIRDEGKELRMEVPYPGAREMLSADIDDRDWICRLTDAIAADLPEGKKKRPAGRRR